MRARFGLKSKMISAFLLAGLIPVLALGLYACWQAESGLKQLAEDKLVALRSAKGDMIQRYFQQVHDQTVTLAHNPAVKMAMTAFTLSFKNYLTERNLSEIDILALKKDLTIYYNEDFQQKFKSDNEGSEFDTQNYINQLSDSEVALQHTYIKNNSNPLGSKDALIFANDNTTYSKYHALYHPVFREIQQKFGYDDVFLVDAQSGHIVYSMFKNLDFTTSLLTGPNRETNFAKVFKEAKELSERDRAILVDFAPYGPSSNTAASFIATPIWDGDEKIGVLMFQIPVEKIIAIMGERSGMGETGESYLVGPDFHLRSDSFLDSKNYNALSSFRSEEKYLVKTLPVERALAGESGKIMSHNYLGHLSFSSYSPIDILGLKWALITEMAQDEAFATLAKLKQTVIVGVSISAVFILFFAMSLSGWLGRSIMSIASRLGVGIEALGKNAQEISQTSTQLTDAGNENMAAIQETVSSVDEISAMVQRNADSAASSTTVSEKSNQVALRGKEIVEQMILSIKEISNSNNDIMIQIEKSNKEISEIVSVIREIGNKTKIINDIVFQTKLLSFNASVEAARAGEHGKGFAVVAEEVGNLANMSGKAAQEITEMLERSIKRVTEIVDNTKLMAHKLIAKGKEKVDHGTKTAGLCGDALDEILQNFSTVNEMVREIANASGEQATGINEVTKAMAQLDKVTHQNSAIAQNTQKMAMSLEQSSRELNIVTQDLLYLVGIDFTSVAISEQKRPAPISVADASSVSASNSSLPLAQEKKLVSGAVKLNMAKADKANVLKFSEKERPIQRPVVETKIIKRAPLPLKSTGTEEMGIPDRNDPRFEEI